MKSLLKTNLIVLVLLLSLGGAGGSALAGLIEGPVAGLPTSGPSGMSRVVTDGTTMADCSTGGGRFAVLCTFDGSSTWTAGGGGGAGGAPTTATYITQTANGSLSNEQALASLATGCLGSTTTTGVVASRTITGTSNEISVANGDCSGTPTLSLPSTLNLSSKTVRIPNGTSLPGTCTVGDEYMDTDATTGQRFYLCQSANTWALQGDGGGGVTVGAAVSGGTAQRILIVDGSGNIGQLALGNGEVPTASAGSLVAGTIDGPTKALDNLASVALNTALLPDAAAADDFGSATLPFKDYFLAGSSGTPGTNNFKITGASTSGTRVITLPDATDTLMGKATTDTVTNKTLNAESTGNVITLPKRIWFPVAGCNNATAGSVWDLPTSNPAVAVCVTGTNTQKGVLEFADSASLSAQTTYLLPTTWTGTVDANIKWVTSATSGNVVWQLATICVADAETDDPAFNAASTVTDAAKGTTLQTNDAAITTVTVTGCAAGELMHLKILRDAAHASDTLAATARLIGIELVIREAL